MLMTFVTHFETLRLLRGPLSLMEYSFRAISVYHHKLPASKAQNKIFPFYKRFPAMEARLFDNIFTYFANVNHLSPFSPASGAVWPLLFSQV